MNRKAILENARTSAAIALGIAGVFGTTFAITTLVAQAAEEQQPAAAAPAAPAEEPLPNPAPTADAPRVEPAPRAQDAPPRSEPPRPPRPAFKDLDTNGDGNISQTEFDAFHPAPPPRFEDGP